METSRALLAMDALIAQVVRTQLRGGDAGCWINRLLGVES